MKVYPPRVNPLADDKNLVIFKLEAFADDNFNRAIFLVAFVEDSATMSSIRNFENHIS